VNKLFCFLLLLFHLTVDAEVKRYLVGNSADVKPQLHGPAFHLQGGGTDVNASFQWMFDQVRGCSVCPVQLDVVVLRASGGDGYNDYLFAMNGVDSVETLVITDRSDASRKDIEATIRNAEVVFFAGGDQCKYVTYFKGTSVEAAVESVFQRGGGLGGTSAGVAILGDVTYDACTGSTRGFEGLADPYHESISFTYDFFHLPNMQGTITDQHLVERDRIGRTFAFLARQIQDKKVPKILGVAIDRETSVALNQDGLGTVMGKGPAYFILADHEPEVCQPKQPLTYSNFKIWKLNAGGTFDLKNRPENGYYLRSVTKGVINENPY
jgi:cyanophycinase